MHDTAELRIDRLRTPLGPLAIVVDARGCLRAVGWFDGHARMQRLLGGAPLVEERDPAGRTSALARYFDGDLDAIEGLPVAFSGTDFQRRVWTRLREIPCGETWSYAELARRIGNPRAVRAVGLANGANPVGIVVPCHRVIGADGSMTGYGAGVERKRWLLEHERGARVHSVRRLG
jgi:methylated-DNA-[protein]-cysteine S-methyltransferase